MKDGSGRVKRQRTYSLCTANDSIGETAGHVFVLGGMASDGSSVLCTLSASSLLKELRYHEEVLRDEEVRQAVAEVVRGKGHDVEPTLEFELVILEELAPTPGLVATLTAEGCISRDLCSRGLVIVEKRSRAPIAIHDSGLTPFPRTSEALQ